MAISKIQELINERASKKLRADIKKISEVLSNGKGYDLLRKIDVSYLKNEKPITTTISYLLTASALGEKVFDENIESYIEQETKDFVEKVETLRDDVDHLLDNL